ncbi:DinB family protein [Fulvivirgaceae bacterium PWU5]|uniref:DinB family protein n=2 Tax=Dawidia cretensis TaxID=2782350 RepID=A0AAP2DWW5_9BACT|nr:DinB family protein [Dawidia cretensis]
MNCTAAAHHPPAIVLFAPRKGGRFFGALFHTKRITMDIIHLPHDIQLVTLQATSFPDGIQATFDALKEMLGDMPTQTFYGVSHADPQGRILYYAAASLADAQQTVPGTKSFTIRNGNFISLPVRQWRENIPAITTTFHTLMQHADIDPDGYCLEEYGCDTMRCFVPLRPGHVPAQTVSLTKRITEVLDDFCETLSKFTDAQLNQAPSEGGWNAGQVAEHISISIEALPDGHTAEANRFIDEKVIPINDVFLDFEAKYESPEFVLPKQVTHDKAALIKTLRDLAEKHAKAATDLDLTVLCMDFEFPTLGYMTRYEWLNFFVVHTQRHLRQLKNIYRSLNA